MARIKNIIYGIGITYDIFDCGTEDNHYRAAEELYSVTIEEENPKFVHRYTFPPSPRTAEVIPRDLMRIFGISKTTANKIARDIIVQYKNLYGII